MCSTSTKEEWLSTVILCWLHYVPFPRKSLPFHFSASKDTAVNWEKCSPYEMFSVERTSASVVVNQQRILWHGKEKKNLITCCCLISRKRFWNWKCFATVRLWPAVQRQLLNVTCLLLLTPPPKKKEKKRRVKSYSLYVKWRFVTTPFNAECLMNCHPPSPSLSWLFSSCNQ